MATRTRKIAAALAAVEMLLAEEAAFATPARASDVARNPITTTSPWSLAGRLALMSARMGSLQHAARRPGS